MQAIGQCFAEGVCSSNRQFKPSCKVQKLILDIWYCVLSFNRQICQRLHHVIFESAYMWDLTLVFLRFERWIFVVSAHFLASRTLLSGGCSVFQKIMEFRIRFACLTSLPGSRPRSFQIGVDVKDRFVKAKHIQFHCRRNLQRYDLSARSNYNLEILVARSLPDQPTESAILKVSSRRHQKSRSTQPSVLKGPL